MAVTLGQKPSPTKVFFPLILFIALGAAGYFYWTGSEAINARKVLSQNLSRVESEKGQLSAELVQAKQKLSEMEAKLSEVEQSMEEAVRAKELAESNLKQKTDEVTSMQGHYEKRIGELENDVKRYADFSAVLAAEMKPLKDVIIAGGSGRSAPIVQNVNSKSEPGSANSSSIQTVVSQSADLVAGQVLAVNRDYGFVIVSFGSESGAAVGRVIQLYRKGDPLGLGRIEKVKGAISAASVVSEDLMSRVQKGDHVVLL